MEPIKSNELIAVFDGKIKDEDSPWYGEFDFMIHGQRRCHAEQLKYDTDWNWLMGVVEKIEGMKFGEYYGFTVNISKNYCSIIPLERKKFETILYKTPSDVVAESKLSEVYKAVLVFIEFFNTNPIKS